jgi:hypothetical protein
MTVSVAAMRRSPQTDVPVDDFNMANADFQVHPEEGHRLVKAFLRISSPERRQAVLKYVTDIARADEAERTH